MVVRSVRSVRSHTADRNERIVSNMPISIMSKPTPKPQPAGPDYSINDALPLFDTWTRARYKAVFGVDAPKYDPSRDVKLWLETPAVPGFTTYTTLKTNPDGSYTEPVEYVQFYLKPSIASTLNLPPGPVSPYPVWDPAESDARMYSGGVPVSPIDPFYLSTLDQASNLYSMLGGYGGIQLWTPEPGPGNIHVVYGTDPRREYQFDVHGGILNVGLLLKQMYVNGVGAPGEWAFDTNGVPKWVPAPQPPPLPVNYKVTSMPMRKLYKNETWIYPVIGQPMIQRTK